MATQNPIESAASGSARERLLDAAEALIYAGGIHATGVDAIVKQSGTARKSFYTHFESKDALVAAALERRDERWMNWFIAGTLQQGKTAREHLLGMFDVLREWFASEDFHGCAFLNAAGEIASAEDPIRIVAREHKERLLAFVRTQCDDYAAESGMDAPPRRALVAPMADPARRRHRCGVGERRGRRRARRASRRRGSTQYRVRKRIEPTRR